MIALTVASSWLALTAVGFAGLSALNSAESRKDHRAGLATPESEPKDNRSASSHSALLDARNMIAGTLPA